jgi:competence protein ComGC
VEFLKDIWNFIKERKKFWLMPVIIVIVLLGVLLVFAASSAIGPFIYPLF